MDITREVASILDSIKEREKKLMSDYGLEEYESLDDIDPDELDNVDIDGKKAIQDLLEYKRAVRKVEDLLKEQAASGNPKVLHRIRKDYEKSIHELRSIKAAKREEIALNTEICSSLDELIDVCKQSLNRL